MTHSCESSGSAQDCNTYYIKYEVVAVVCLTIGFACYVASEYIRTWWVRCACHSLMYTTAVYTAVVAECPCQPRGSCTAAKPVQTSASSYFNGSHLPSSKTSYCCTSKTLLHPDVLPSLFSCTKSLQQRKAGFEAQKTRASSLAAHDK